MTSNKYLEKIALFLRSAEGLINRAGSLETAVANRVRNVNMGLSNKAVPARANLKSQTLNNQLKNKMWKA